MRLRLHDFPLICQQAWQQAQNFELPNDFQDVNKIVVLGIGGSAIGGDLVSSYLEDKGVAPILINRDYSLPHYIDERTLVIASSYSGNTEETLSSFQKALTIKCKKLVLTTGGKLAKLAVNNEVPLFIFDYDAQPRAALPYSMLPLLNFVPRIGLIDELHTEVNEMIVCLKKLNKKLVEAVETRNNLAKQAANRLSNKLVIVYGAEFLTEVAHRFKTQLNENSKCWSFYENLPELNHNAIVGYKHPQGINSKAIILFLFSKYFSKRTIKRMQITAELLKKAGVAFHTLKGYGTSQLAQMMSHILFNDWVSYYLSILYETNPTPVHAIDYLKAKLTEE
jgi:glucose/mannose-6-phosphate isomerase